MKVIKAILGLVFTVLLASCGSQDKKQADLQKSSKAATLPYYAEASFTPNWLEEGDEALQDFHQIPDFELYSQLGDTITANTLDGKIYVADFFFTICPGICPKMTSNMAILQEEFSGDEEVMLLSHTVTPEMDSVSVLHEYGELKGINPDKWLLLTGERKTIYDLGRQFYFAEEDRGLNRTEDEFLHTENFLLIDKNRHIRGIYNGLNKTDINQLIADIKTLQQEYAL